MRVTKEEAMTLIEAYGTLHGFWMMDKDGNGTCELDDLGELLAVTMAGVEVHTGYRIGTVPFDLSGTTGTVTCATEQGDA